MSDNGAIKICLAASAGGHLSQLVSLEAAWRRHAYFFVTTSDIVSKELKGRFNARVYVVTEANREHPLKVLRLARQCMRILWDERPDVILSTGAAPGAILSLLGKLAGAKVIWLDSIANAERISLSGRIVRRFADLFLVQWAELARPDRAIEYHGEVI